MKSVLPMMISVRGYVVPMRVDDQTAPNLQTKRSQRKVRKALPRPSNTTVVFDTETTTDAVQRLRIGAYQVRKAKRLHERGIFYEPENISARELQLVKAYSGKHGLLLRTREEFVRQVLYIYGYDHGGLILGFNLPFDVSRLAIKSSTSHGKDMRGGFTFELLPEKWRPNILVKHLNSRTAFIRFAAAPRAVDGRGMRKKGFKTQAKTGYFQDLKTLAAALLGRSFNLASLADHLQVDHRKLETGGHGRELTEEYLNYACGDVDVTWDCYVALLRLYEAHGLSETPPHRVYSEASLGKAYLRQMNIDPWGKQQPDFAPELLGIIMSTYYGGRSEVRIRREMTRVLYCDFRSMYPTVCTLMRLWRFVIATGIEHEDWTLEAQMLLNRVGPKDLRYKNMWPFLTTLVRVEPDGDIFPVRAQYGEGSRTIGINYLSASFGMWFTLADCIAAKLLGGKSPKIVQAIRFTPKMPQTDLKPISIGGNNVFRIDPNMEGFDLYKRIIELRGKVQSEMKQARANGKTQGADLLDSYQKMLKLLANSTSYGIFAEMNVQSYERPRSATCYGTEDASFAIGPTSIEEPGTHFHPLLAALITGAARLMLAIAERLASDNGIGWALCDTDSLALARPQAMPDSDFLKRAIAITKWFDALNPYDDDKPLFKIEDQNYRIANGELQSGAHEPLYALAISAKRYVLFNLDSKEKPLIRKAVAHGLGHLRPPYGEADAPQFIPGPVVSLSTIGVERWQYDLWYQIVMAELDGHPDQIELFALPALDKPALSRYSAATPHLLSWFKTFNAEKPHADRVKPFNFMVAFQVSKTALYSGIASGEIDAEFVEDGLPAVVAPYDDEPTGAAAKCFDRRSGRHAPASILATYYMALADYHLHSESKFDNAEAISRGVTQRRHVEAVAVEYIGKEANRWEEQFFLGDLPEANVEYGLSLEGVLQIIAYLRVFVRRHSKAALAREAAISRQQLIDILNEQVEPRLSTLRALIQAARALEHQGSQPENDGR